MKTYKEIQTEIKIPDDLRNAVIDSMICKPKSHDLKVKIVVACVVIGLCALPILNLEKSSFPTKRGEQTVAKSKQFHIKDYLVQEPMESLPATAFGLISDKDLKVMDQEMLKTVQADFPTLEHLYVPDGFESQLFYLKLIDGENPNHFFPYIDYYAVKDENTLKLTIQDQRIPQGLIREAGEPYLKGYKDYQIAVKTSVGSSGEKLFWVYGTYKNYYIEVYGMVDHVDDFEQFMQSFLK